MILFDSETMTVEGGVMFGRVTIDGTDVRAGITIEAFERLIARAGYDPDRDFGRIMVGDIMGMLKPTIEAHLQTKHFREGLTGAPIIIDVADLVTH
jgi:hypothetical protein